MDADPPATTLKVAFVGTQAEVRQLTVQGRRRRIDPRGTRRPGGAMNIESVRTDYAFYVPPRDEADKPWDTTGDGIPDLLIVDAAGKLMNLEISPPGSDPRKRASALHGLGDTLGTDAHLDALTLVPGVGKRTAQRLLIELQARLVPPVHPYALHDETAGETSVGGEQGVERGVGSQGDANVSHGCVGMSTADAAWLYNLTKRGVFSDDWRRF